MSAYSDAVLSDTPVAYWRLNETSGTVANDEAGTYDGTYEGTPVLGDAGPPGISDGKAVTIDASGSEYISLGEPSGLPSGDSARSVDFWYKCSGTQSQRAVFGYGDTDAVLQQFVVLFDYGSRGFLVSWYGQESLVPLDSYGFPQSDGAWHHYAVTWNPTNRDLEFFLDGQSVGTVDVGANPRDTQTDAGSDAAILTLYYAGGFTQAASLSELAVYDYILSSSRIATHYQIGSSTIYSGVVFSDSPIAYWRLGETSGTTANNLIALPDGTYTGGFTLGTTGLITGDSDKAVSVDGVVGSYVSVPDNAAIDQGDGPFSWELWFQRSNATRTEVLMNKGNGALIIYFVSTELRIGIRDTATIMAYTLAGTDRHHVVVTKDSSSTSAWRLFVDGAEVAPTINPLSAASTGDPLRFGQDSDSTDPFLGVIDEVALYGSVLPPDRIALHYAAGATGGVPARRFLGAGGL